MYFKQQFKRPKKTRKSSKSTWKINRNPFHQLDQGVERKEKMDHSHLWSYDHFKQKFGKSNSTLYKKNNADLVHEYIFQKRKTYYWSTFMLKE